MGNKDDALYDYFVDNEKFADFYNGAVFNGRIIVDANMLSDGAERYVGVEIEKTASKKLKYKNRYRDVKKHLGNGTNLAILAIENQSDVDYSMPWRIMQYDQLEYGRQIQKIREHKTEEYRKKGKKIARWQIKLTSEDKLNPVYTLCFYHGTEEWNGPKSLMEMMNFGEGNEALKELFHDYKLTLVCVDDLEDLSVFRTDVRLLLQALKMRNNGETMDTLFKHEEYQCVSEVTARTIAAMTDYTEILEYLEDRDGEGEVNMCIAVEEIREKYINKGIETGMERGIKEGLKEGIRALITTCQELNASYEYVLAKLEEKYDLSHEDARNYMNLYWIQ